MAGKEASIVIESFVEVFSMEFDLFFVDGVLAFALMAFMVSLGPVVGAIFKACCPTVIRSARRFGRRHPALFTESEDFYCFFHKDALYGV